MSDKIAEIRARYEAYRLSYDSVANEDRGWLLAEVERLRAALADMLAGWRYVRETYGDLAGVGWDRAEAKAQEALEDGQ